MRPTSNILVATVLALVNQISLAQDANEPKEPTTETPSVTLSPATQNAQSGYVQPEGEVYQGLSDPRWKWWNEMSKRDPAFEWKVPINFWGKVVDQDNQPLEGADIRFGWNDVEGSHERFCKSDGQGLFSIAGIRGKLLSVKVSKLGYHALGGAAGRGFEYAAFFEGDYHRPNQQKPVIFRVLKKLPQEALAKKHFSTRIEYGRELCFNLRSGLLNQGGGDESVQVKVERSSSEQGQPYDWSVHVQVPNGGLQETTDEFPQLAPDDGYVNSWDVAVDSRSNTFKAAAKTRIYVRTGNMSYGCIDLEIANPNSRELGARVTLDSYFNLSGSRNLDANRPIDPSPN